MVDASVFTRTILLHGDRYAADATDLDGGFAWVERYRCIFIQNSGQGWSPASVYKTLRLLRLAEHLHLPVMLLGGMAHAEKDAAPEATASSESQLLAALVALKTPLISTLSKNQRLNDMTETLCDVVIAPAENRPDDEFAYQPTSPHSYRRAVYRAFEYVAGLDADALAERRAARLREHPQSDLELESPRRNLPQSEI